MKKTKHRDLLNPFGFGDILIYIVLFILSFCCLMPVVNMFAIAFSSAAAADAGLVYFWPKQFSLAAFEEIIREGTYFRAMLITLERIALGWSFSMFFMITIIL